MKTFGAPSSRFTFTLNVDTAVIDAQLGCIPITRNFSHIPKNSTKIDELLPSNSTFSFIDPSKKTKKWITTMRDTISKKFLHFVTSGVCCRCHLEFKGAPIGCPLRIIENYEKINYYSHVMKKDIITDGELIERYYLTERMFCSWGCVFGYAEGLRHSILHRQSIQLLYLMYRESGGKGIPVANPDFTILKRYGGPLSDEDYRGRFQTDTYRPTGNHYVYMVPVGEISELSSRF